MKNMLEALAYIHKNKVVHRDLKPANIILMSKDNDYDVRIADFGLATFIKPDEVLTMRCGTPGYVAPEVLEDAGYDEKSDIFSVGAILFIMLTGRPVFRGYNNNALFLKNKQCEIVYEERYWSKISEEAKSIVGLMLMKDPKLRISAEDALKHKWLNQNENEINNVDLDFAKGIEENKN